MIKTAICELFGIKHPIIQGGMAWVSTARLVSAVSNAGALGILGTGDAHPDWIRQQIHLTKELTSQPFGINILLDSPHINQIINLIIMERVTIVTTGIGNPANLIPRFKKRGIKVLPVISNVSMARHLEKSGADALITEGMESGGHIGELTTMALVPQIVDRVKIPVIAAGGIADGRGLAAALVLGAQGVQIGTRFVCSEECGAHQSYKERIIKSTGNATVITGQKLKRPLRSLRNKLTNQLRILERAGLTQKELRLFNQGRIYLGIVEGDTVNGYLLAGQIAGLVKHIQPAEVIVNNIITEAEIILKHAGQQTSKETNQ